LLKELTNTRAKNVIVSDVGAPRMQPSVFSKFSMLSSLTIQNMHFESLFALPLYIRAGYFSLLSSFHFSLLFAKHYW
jgi:hypothetical protein